MLQKWLNLRTDDIFAIARDLFAKVTCSEFLYFKDLQTLRASKFVRNKIVLYDLSKAFLNRFFINENIL